ncbi:O-antigen ligase family protein [Clostridium ganghwense]|uniref:O-antigen ligase family protein n=1 Tax=Clostridium ganghwense TaxID=312089 RepID=A0ABT4CQH7_9CLOT|nr:O-antigen ligase family protein [Clostridium ganghwense]MCY6370496.1 O-antigen ligase family protein [Clostridium ganghwense]
MIKKKSMLSCLIYLYIILMPILPSKFKGIPLGDIILFLIGLVYLFTILIYSESRERFIKGIQDFFTDYLSIFMVLLFIVMCISVSYASYKTMALKESLRFVTYIIIYFIIKYEITEKYILDNIIKTYLLVVAAISSFGIIQYFTKIGLSKEFIYDKGYAFKVRIPSTLENPNSLGAFLILAIFPLIMITLYEKNKSKKMLYGIISMVVFINIVLSGSRNTWGGFLIGAFIFIIIYNWKAIFLFLLGGASALMIPSVRNRIGDFKLVFKDPRVNLWKIALEMIKDHPIVGVGNGNYYSLYGAYVKKHPELDYNHHVNFPVHNSYLKIQSELGIAGSVSFVGILVSVLVKIKTFINITKNGFYKAFYKGLLISIIVFYIMNISDNLFFVPKISMYFWILVAISQSMLYNNSRDFI